MSVATKVKIVDHALVASFRDSNPPTVWRMDLEKNHSFAVAIQGREGDWELGIMSPRGEFTVVARFVTRGEVDVAFDGIQKVLLSAPNSFRRKLLRAAVLTATVVGIIVLGVAIITLVPTGSTVTTSAPQVMSAPAVPAVPIQSGIPLPADEVLRGQ
jgi:hypothetical protein